MKSKHTFKFGQLELLDTYAVIICNEGVNIDFDEVLEIQAVLYRFYQGKAFGLIANRINCYSVNPQAIAKLFTDICILAGAIVSDTKAAKINAELENYIVEVAPIKYFTKLESAIEWINTNLKENKNQ